MSYCPHLFDDHGDLLFARHEELDVTVVQTQDSGQPVSRVCHQCQEVLLRSVLFTQSEPNGGHRYHRSH